MKKRIIILFVLTSVLIQVPVGYAQKISTASSKTATGSAEAGVDKEIVDLKERLANKVAEMRKSDQKAISGFATVKDGLVSINNIEEDASYSVKIDSALTKIYQIAGATKKELKSDDIKSGMYLIITGPVVDKSINANVVYVDEAFIVRAGVITEVNKTDYYIKVSTFDKQEYSIDIESGTKQNMLNIKTLEIEKTGFSKIKEGDTVHFVAKQDEENMNTGKRFAATKILIIPQEYFIK